VLLLTLIVVRHIRRNYPNQVTALGCYPWAVATASAALGVWYVGLIASLLLLN
jgi:hypothetical protein